MEEYITNENYNKFISVCNSITRYLKNAYSLKENATFGEVLRDTEKQNRVINHYWDDLQVFLELRNILVHNQYGDFLIANPSNEILKNIESIYLKIKNPSTVGKLFSNKVCCFQEDETMDALLKIVKEKDYTQFPIFNNKGFSGMITENAITRWISKKIDDDIISIKDTKIKDVLPLEEVKENFRLILPNKTVYDVLSIFKKSYNNNNKTLVLLISTKKEPQVYNDIQGIITYADYQKINNEV